MSCLTLLFASKIGRRMDNIHTRLVFPPSSSPYSCFSGAFPSASRLQARERRRHQRARQHRRPLGGGK